MKKLASSLILFFMLFFCFSTVFANNAAANEIKLRVDGNLLENLSASPVILNDYTMVPARDVFEELGAHVTWNPTMQLVYIVFGEDHVLLQIGSTVAHLNDRPIVMDVAPAIIEGRTMIPVRFAAENLGFAVGWNPDTRVVSIDSPQQQLPLLPAPPENAGQANSGQANGAENTSIPGKELQNVNIIPAQDVSPAPLTNMSFPETSITAINMVMDTRQGIDILASSEISTVSVELLPDNRLIIDFYDAQMNVSATEFTPPVVSTYSQIRVAQFQVTPAKITRVVVELGSGVNYALTMSTDRKSLSIDFEKNQITNVSHRIEAAADYITITGVRPPIVDISHLSNPSRLVIDLPFALINPQEIPVNSSLISAARPGQFSEDTARVVLDLSDRVSFSVSHLGNTVTIRVTEPTFRNIWYDNDTRVLRLARSQFAPVSADNISSNDRYLDRQYAFTLSGDFGETYGFGRYEINDTHMRFIDIETINGITHITANTRRISAAQITEDTNFIYITFKNPREVYDRIVVIDPGHGGTQPGTTAGPIHEKYLVMDVAMKLYELFNNSDIKVYSTRLSDTTVSLSQRAAMANEVGDLFISIHMNSVWPNQTPNGTETFYHQRDASAYNGLTSAQMAEIFQRHMLEALETNDRGVKRGAFDVLVFTNIPAVLSEIGFLSNPDEAARLQDEAFQQLAAEALFSATLEAFSVYTPRR